MSDRPTERKRARVTHTTAEASSSDEEVDTAQTVRHYGSSTLSGQARTWGSTVKLPSASKATSNSVGFPTDSGDRTGQPTTSHISLTATSIDGAELYDDDDENMVILGPAESQETGEPVAQDAAQLYSRNGRLLRPSVIEACIIYFLGSTLYPGPSNASLAHGARRLLAGRNCVRRSPRHQPMLRVDNWGCRSSVKVCQDWPAAMP